MVLVPEKFTAPLLLTLAVAMVEPETPVFPPVTASVVMVLVPEMCRCRH